MKKHALLLSAVLVCSAFAVAEDLELDTPHVAVYGTAEIKVTPNEMIWSLHVKTENEELPTVAAQHTATVQQVLSFLKGLKIKEEKIQTSSMQFGENWKTVNRERVKTGYVASTNIGFTISDLGLYQKLWFGLASIEGVSIQGTQYNHSDRIKYQNESRVKAVLVAREKADTLARTLGTQIIEPLKIEEMPVSNHFGIMNANFASNRSDDMGGQISGQSLSLGQITISTKVRVFFKIMSRQ